MSSPLHSSRARQWPQRPALPAPSSARTGAAAAVFIAGSALARAATGLLSRAVHPSSDTPPAARELSDPTQLGTLVYELLDAHSDTAELAAELEYDPVWSAHLEYLRALQREGRAVLAQMAVGDAA